MELKPSSVLKRTLTEEELTLREETALAIAQATIQNAIDDAELSRADFARRMGCSPSYVTRILQGDHNLTIRTLARALGACGQQLSLDSTVPQCSWAASTPRKAELSFTSTGAGYRQQASSGDLAFAA